MTHPPKPLGILAFGSLISDPGKELKPLITMRIRCETPFPVEFGRYSTTRSDAPTLVPHKNGKPVSAEILVLEESVSMEEAQNMLWRRETRREGTSETYPAGTGKNAVQVRETTHPSVRTVLYTDFNPEGKIEYPMPEELAKKAIESVSRAKPGMDGISYLMKAIAAGIETPLTSTYRNEILKQTETDSLEAALKKVKSP